MDFCAETYLLIPAFSSPKALESIQPILAGAAALPGCAVAMPANTAAKTRLIASKLTLFITIKTPFKMAEKERSRSHVYAYPLKQFVSELLLLSFHKETK